MFRLSQLLAAAVQDKAPRTLAGSGPVVVWNLLRRCNLACSHCYTASTDRDYQGETTTEEALRLLEELRQARVPALILSGGEPLLRPDLDLIARRAKELGFYLALSTNGTLIHEAVADRLATIGYDYVGISLDGLPATHDRIRGRQGAFAASLAGMRHCLARGVRAGVRMTLTADNSAELPELLAWLGQEGVTRFYLSHLNYAGRGKANRLEDAAHLAVRQTMLLLFETALADLRQGRLREIVTGNNDADGPFLWLWLRQREPALADRLWPLLVKWGGNASGIGIANIDNRGLVHPDIFWGHHTLGNARQRPFGEIWHRTDDPILAGLRHKPRPVKGRCATCRFLALCGGNTRVRAFQRTGDPWAEDPGCYLTDDEITTVRENPP